MTEYIKQESDRPDFFVVVRDVDGRRVDLTGATNVQFVLFHPDGTEAINAAATVELAHLGEVSYDFTASQTQPPGRYHAELRVDWADADEQWFPIDEPSYPVEVVAPPSGRGDGYGTTAYGDTNYGGGVPARSAAYGDQDYGTIGYGGEP